MLIFLSGDVMVGRGIDQALPQPCAPMLHESVVHSAVEYVQLAQRANGPFSVPVTDAYIWGAALEELDRRRPVLRIANLETSVTRSEDFLDKGINYRVSPENARCLVSAGLDCCTLANNHVLDWGVEGLRDTLTALDRLRIRQAGAGFDAAGAERPAAFSLEDGHRLLLFACACASAGVPGNWAAGPGRPGICLLPDLSDRTFEDVRRRIVQARRGGDVVIVSIHWGPNWGHRIPAEQRRFARRLIDEAGVSVVHGHSSHHVKAVEIHDGRAIIYGCGDLMNDYEGIGGYHEYRPDMAALYFLNIDPPTGRITEFEIVPMQIRRFRLNWPVASDVSWLSQTLNRESRDLNTGVAAVDGRLLVRRAPA